MKWSGLRVGAAFALIVGLAACSGVLGLDGFHVGDLGEDGGGDASMSADASGDVSVAPVDGGNVDAQADAQSCTNTTKNCYQCTPMTDDQFLNSCSAGQCQPFDVTRISAFLLADGGLPPLPDGGEF